MVEKRQALSEPVDPPVAMTEPCRHFFEQHYGLWMYFGGIARLATSLDEIWELVIRLESEEEQQEARRKRVTAVETFKRRSYMTLEMWVTRLVDNYLSYVSELLALIFKTRPETLRAAEREQVLLKTVLDSGNLDELIDAVTEQRVERLSYKSMDDLNRYLKEKLGFPLFESNDDLEHATRLGQVRNVVVHNRSIKPRSQRAHLVPGDVGERMKLHASIVTDDGEWLAQLVAKTDRRATSKYKLPTPVSREAFKEQMEKSAG